MHSSNSIHVLQSAGLSSVADDHPSFIGCVTGVAQCDTTLELIPFQPNGIAMLKEAIPVFSTLENVQTSDASKSLGKQALLMNLPLSSTEFSMAWDELCAFEFESQIWRPSSATICRLWVAITNAAILRGISLQDPLNHQAIGHAVEEDGFPFALFNAFTDQVKDRGKPAEQGCRFAPTPIIQHYYS